MSTTFLTASPFQTRKAGEKIAKEIFKIYHGEKPAVFGLVGDLGGGKTTFLQGFAKGLGIKEKLLSPTFVIMKRFKIKDPGFNNFYHIDCYRIKKPEELSDLGFKKIISDRQNIVAVEWADRVKKIMPRKTIWLNFEFVNDKTRKIMIR